MPRVRLTEADSGRLVALQPGDELELALAERPTAGYVWSLEPGSTGPMTVAESAFVRAGELLPGGGGARVFRFVASTPGHAHLHLKLARQLHDDAAVLKRFSLTVNVTAP